MNIRKSHPKLMKVLFLIILLPLSGFAENWPQFRGPGGVGIAANAETIPGEWSETKNLRWKTDLPGKGSSSPVIWGDRIFLTSYSGYGESKENPGDRAELKRHLICLNKADGRVLLEQNPPGHPPGFRVFQLCRASRICFAFAGDGRKGGLCLLC